MRAIIEDVAKKTRVFSQLSLLDDAKIQERVKREIKEVDTKSPCPKLVLLIARLNLAYKYALEITNTIAV